MPKLLSRKFLNNEFVTQKRLEGYTLKAIGLMFDPPLQPGTVYTYDKSRDHLGIDARNLVRKEQHQTLLNERGYTPRKCLSCQTKFFSEDPPSVNRICPNCKHNNRAHNGYEDHNSYASTGRARR